MSFAEREGFEPPVPLGTAVFKTAVIDHSTISPGVILHYKRLMSEMRCKGTAFFFTVQVFHVFFYKKMLFGLSWLCGKASTPYYNGKCSE